MNIKTTFPARLHMARLKEKMNQTKLAEKCGMTPASISAYERGTKTPSLSAAINLAKALDVSLDWLAGVDLPAPEEEISAADVARMMLKLEKICYGTSFDASDGLLSAEYTIDIKELSDFFEDYTDAACLIPDTELGREVIQAFVENRINRLEKIIVN